MIKFKIKLKSLWEGRRTSPPLPIFEKGIIGSGLVYRGRHYITHTTLPFNESAVETFTIRQKFYIFLLAILIVTGLVFNPIFTGSVVLGILSIIYFADVIFGLYTLGKNLDSKVELTIAKEEILKVSDNELPIYTILCPLYKEKEILHQFISAIDALNWPKEKLDVILLLEEDDKDTISLVHSLFLSSFFRIVVVPHSYPKTKPKACNYGLTHARGKYLVIYDAEDRPDPDQLKKAYIAFRKSRPSIICLQCKLNYYNTNQNLLTMLFTAEYSLWFDLTLPGLQSIETTIPLGGTSNHFRTAGLRYLHGWDPFNVTEDCDLGIRLFKEGFKTAIIDSTTYEEANSRISSWINQRSRWIKGYFQTYLVHTRDPLEFFRRHKTHALIFHFVIGARILFIVLNPFLWAMIASYFLLNQYVGETIELLYPPVIFYLACITTVFGNFIFFYNYMIGCAKRNQWELVKYIFLIPFYWFITSVAAVKALYQLVVSPYYWEKTPHGLYSVKSQKSWLKVTARLIKRIKERFSSQSGYVEEPDYIGSPV